jgi:hypothetical protein
MRRSRALMVSVPDTARDLAVATSNDRCRAQRSLRHVRASFLIASGSALGRH